MASQVEHVTKESFRAELQHLVDNFAANEAELTSPGYPEMQCRTQFITLFFRALGCAPLLHFVIPTPPISWEWAGEEPAFRGGGKPNSRSSLSRGQAEPNPAQPREAWAKAASSVVPKPFPTPRAGLYCQV